MAVNYTNLYNRLATKINKLRKRLIRKKRQYEREDEEMRIKGRYPRPRPDFEVPMKQRLLESTKEQLTKEAYQRYQAQAKALFGGTRGAERDFYKMAYWRNYLETLSGKGFLSTQPNGNVYTKDQIDKASPEDADLMHLYNMVFRMGVDKFMWLYDRNLIVKLGFIYQGSMDVKITSFYEEQQALREQGIRELRVLTTREMKKGVTQVKSTKHEYNKKLGATREFEILFDKYGKIK